MAPPTTRSVVYLEIPHLLDVLNGTWFVVGDDVGFMCMPPELCWLAWLIVELFVCWFIESEEAATNGANVNPDDENDDWGFSVFCCNCADGRLNGE